MDEQGLLHILNSNYCFARAKDEVEIRLRCTKGDLDEVKLIYGCKYDFYLKQNYRQMKKAFSDRLYDYYITVLKLSDLRLTYIFELSSEGKKYFFSEDGVSDKYDFSFSYYNCFQVPYINIADLHNEVEWMRTAVFYQIFVDRFFMAGGGDKSYVNLNWGDIPKQKSFAGGDIKGITQKLDYISSLGVNALYLTPIFESVSNHKYDTKNYSKIDYQFGSDDDLQELTFNAHSRGMKIVLDAVYNHCSELLPQFQDVIKNGEKSVYKDWFIIKKYAASVKDMQLECFASCKYMPKLNTSNAEVQQFLISQAMEITKKFGIDGWRLDVSDEVSHDFWRSFRKAIKGINQDIVIIGENWHNAESNLRGDQFDSIMNYAYTKSVMDYIAYSTLDAKGFAERLSGITMRNTTMANRMMLNLLDCHDTHRFINVVSDNIKKLKTALAITFLYDGAPCVYYGTEIALAGGYDPDSRRCMDWDKAAKGHKVMEVIKALSALRRDYAECFKGEMSIGSENGVFVLRREGVSRLVLYVNSDEKAKKIRHEGKIAEVEAQGFTIYHSEKGKVL